MPGFAAGGPGAHPRQRRAAARRTRSAFCGPHTWSVESQAQVPCSDWQSTRSGGLRASTERGCEVVCARGVPWCCFDNCICIGICVWCIGSCCLKKPTVLAHCGMVFFCTWLLPAEGGHPEARTGTEWASQPVLVSKPKWWVTHDDVFSVSASLPADPPHRHTCTTPVARAHYTHTGTELAPLLTPLSRQKHESVTMRARQQAYAVLEVVHDGYQRRCQCLIPWQSARTAWTTQSTHQTYDRHTFCTCPENTPVMGWDMGAGGSTGRANSQCTRVTERHGTRPTLTFTDRRAVSAVQRLWKNCCTAGRAESSALGLPPHSASRAARISLPTQSRGYSVRNERSPARDTVCPSHTYKPGHHSPPTPCRAEDTGNATREKRRAGRTTCE